MYVSKYFICLQKYIVNVSSSECFKRISCVGHAAMSLTCRSPLLLLLVRRRGSLCRRLKLADAFAVRIRRWVRRGYQRAYVTWTRTGRVTITWGQDGARSIRSNGSSVQTSFLAEHPGGSPRKKGKKKQKKTSVFRLKEITSVFGLYKRRNGRTSTGQKNKTKNGL